MYDCRWYLPAMRQFLPKAVVLAVGRMRSARRIDHVLSQCPQSFTCGLRSSKGLLQELCDKWGSDKGSCGDFARRPYPWPPHTFADFYAALFGHMRHHVRLVFECGLGTNNAEFLSNMGRKGRPGASLRVWRDYFPGAMVVGADIDTGVLFREERIETFEVDQTSATSIEMMWQRVARSDFDFMIDDGLHTFDAVISMFAGSFSRVRPGGVYIIEDVSSVNLGRFVSHFSELGHDVQPVVLRRETDPPFDNNLIVIRKSDV